jgi:dTDP-4-dehydrorhamnose reductase
MKILVTGSKGQLGSDCLKVFSGNNQVIGVDIDEVDIRDKNQVETLVEKTRPHVVINCAAFTNVDGAEKNEDAALKINAFGPLNLVKSAERAGALLVHISTDYVFDGTKAIPEAYFEEEETGPVSAYGRTKLEGERLIREETDHYLILRTAWLYGAWGKNFLKTIFFLSRKNQERTLKIVHDQYGSPTWSLSLARQIQILLDKKMTGLYHATSEGYCTWYEFAAAFFDKMAVKARVQPCTTAEYPTPARRPMNSILENRALKRGSVNIMPHWEHDLTQFIEIHKTELMREIEAL